jgi:hypothetical protein
MALAIELLVNVSNVNTFQSATEITFSEGEAIDVYLRLVDSNKKEGAYDTTFLRYIPQGTTTNTLKVDIQNLDDAKKISRYCTQPYATDTSIWKLALTAADALVGTVSLKFTLTETSGGSSVVKIAYKPAAFNVTSVGGSC